jgi:minor extracellular protease Epr
MSDLILPPHIVDTNIVLTQGEARSWGFDFLGIDKLHQAGYDGEDVKIAIIDTYIDGTHPDLIISENINVTQESENRLSHGHGTQVAGIIGAEHDDYGTIGIAPNAEIIAIKGMNEDGGGSYANLITAIHTAIEKEVDVINMSLGGTAPSLELDRVIDMALSKGIVIVCAAGNSGEKDSVMWPGRHSGTICVGASNKQGKVSAFSSRGPQVNVVAPGERIITTGLNHSHVKVTGSSFAAPMVSGVACLLAQKGIKLTSEMIKATATDIGKPGVDNKSGYGLLNPEALFESLDVETVNIDYEDVRSAIKLLQNFLKQNGQAII